MIEAELPLEIIRKPAARRLKLSVDPRSGKVRLVMPKRAALGPALEWVKSQHGWIEAQVAKLPEPWPLFSGMTVPVGGRDLTLNWAEENPRGPKIVGDIILIGGPLEMMEARLIRWLRRQAVMLLDTETREIAAYAGVDIGRVGVGDTRSRWGSCSHDGDIRYSWRLILAPDYVRRATVAHEVAHRIHMDHSPAFHAQVARLYDGDPSEARAWLRRHGPRLHWFGRDA